VSSFELRSKFYNLIKFYQI